ALLANYRKAVFQAKSDALQNRPDEVAAIMAGSKTNPAAACIGIKVWCAFALEVGQKDQAVTAWWDTLGLSGKDFVGVDASPALQRAFWQADVIAYPAEREPSSLRDPHEIPGIGDGMVKRMNTRYRARSIHLWSARVGQDNPAGAYRDQS